MYKIPKVINFQEDELFLSWLYRLTKENAFDDVRHLASAFIFPNAKNRYREPRVDFIDDYDLIWRAIKHTGVDEIQFFFKTTLFNLYSPFMSLEQRQRYILQAFNNTSKFQDLYPAPHGNKSRLLTCPHCSMYFKRSHQLPGVTVCYECKSPLYEVEGPVGWRLKNITVKAKALQPTKHALEYAVFANAILEMELDCSISDIKEVIQANLPGTGTFKDRYKQFIDSIAEYSELTTKDLYKSWTSICSGNYVDVNMVLVILLGMFRTAERFKVALEKVQEKRPEKEFRDYIKKRHYTLLSPFRNDLVRLRHDKCGYEFCTTPYGFRIGWECPRCDSDMTLQEKFAELVYIAGNGEYRVKSEFQSMDKPVMIYHTKCRKERKFKPRSFIYENVRCQCQNTLGYEGVKKAIERYPGFKLEEYTAIDKPLKIRHATCGGIFSFYYSKFMKDPRCRICERQGHLAKRTDDDLKEDIRALTGDEYSLIGHYTDSKTKVEIRHNVCGKSHMYRPYYFLEGQRCPYCTKDSTESEFVDYVQRVSLGRYYVDGKKSKNLYRIKDSVTGSMVPLSKVQTLQELHRPTLSPYLPLEKKNTDTEIRKDSFSESLIKQLTQNNQKLIFLEDICMEGASKDKVRITISNLAKSGKLKHVTNGVYALPEYEYTKDDVIIQKYVLQEGKRIGYFRGESFAYEIGLCEKPAEWHIATNKESYKASNRKISFYGDTIHIKGSQERIEDDNYVILAVLDFVIQWRQVVYGKTEEVVYKAVRNYIKKNRPELLTEQAFAERIADYKTANIREMLSDRIRRIVRAKNEQRNE